MPFTFNKIDLFTVTVDGKPWLSARDVCRALNTVKNQKLQPLSNNIVVKKSNVVCMEYTHL